MAKVKGQADNFGRRVLHFLFSVRFFFVQAKKKVTILLSKAIQKTACTKETVLFRGGKPCFGVKKPRLPHC